MNQLKNYFLCVAAAFLGIGAQVQAAQTPSFWGRLGQAVTRFKMRLTAQPTKRLELAIATGDIAKAQEAIMFGARVNPPTPWSTPLRDATAHGDLDMVKLLVKAGALVNARTPDGTALDSLLYRRWMPQNTRDAIAKTLVEAGAKPEIENPNTLRAPIMEAVARESGIHSVGKYSDPDLLKIFLDQDPWLLYNQGKDGETLFFYAASAPNVQLMRVMSNSIQNPTLSEWQRSRIGASRDAMGRSPYHRIRRSDPHAVEKVKLLQNAGISGLYHRDNLGILPEVLPLVDPTRK